MDGTVATVQVVFNGGVVYEQSTPTLNVGGSYNVSAVVPDLSSQGGSASFVVLDANGNNVSSLFGIPAPNVSYSEE